MSRSGRISWVQRLNLRKKEEITPKSTKKKSCEICNYDQGTLEKAHWIASSNRGSSKNYNMLSLCPNCHTQLDRHNPETTEKALIVLFSRTMKMFFSKNQLTFDEKREALKIAKQIINRVI